MIRRLAPDDWATFRAIRLEALRLEPAAYASTHDDWAQLSEEDWRGRLDANVVFATFCDTETTGIAGLRPDGAVIMVYVRATARGKGHAQLLMQTVRDEARARNMPRLWLHVALDNAPARRLYEWSGYNAESHTGHDILMSRTS